MKVTFMGIKDLFGFSTRSAPVSDYDAVRGLFESWGGSVESGEKVTTETALGVPAIFGAVNFLSGTLASLPKHVYEHDKEKGRKRIRTDIATILSNSPAEGWTAFNWFKYAFDQVLTEGRFVAYIERNAPGRVVNLWPLEAAQTEVEKKGLRKVYHYTENGTRRTYTADQVIDLTFALKPDQVGARNPIQTVRETVGLAIAVEKYAARFFGAGGVPPLALTGPFQTPKGLERGSNEVWDAIKRLVKQRRNVLTIPAGHEIKAIGVEPDKSQLIEVRRFMKEELATVYSLPPVFIQDLTHGTFSNTEQQDLHLVKHTIRRWVVALEQELNLKLFGRRNTSRYVEVNLDGLLRGDFKARMEGYAKGIQNAILTPNEARASENRVADGEGDTLLIQGATVPLGSQPIRDAKAEKQTL